MDGETSPEEKAAAIRSLETLWADGFSVAAHMLGKVWRDGLCGVINGQAAEYWFRCAASAGLDYSQYTLGKLLQAQGRITEAVAWYQQAAAHNNQFARFRLGKLYLLGDGVPKNIPAALGHLTNSAEQGNPFAQYTLGKLYLQGHLVRRDRQQAKAWLTLSAAQGNTYAQFFLDRMDQYRDPSPLLAIGKLLRDLSGVFRANSVPPVGPAGIRMDSKRRRKLQQKRLAMGHRLDDHEDLPMQQRSFTL